MIFDPKDMERGIENPRDLMAEEARKVLKEFINGNYSPAVKLLESKLGHLENQREQELKPLEYAGGVLESARESVDIDNISEKGKYIKQAEERFREVSERFQMADKELKRFKGLIETLKKKIAEKPLS